MTVFEDIKYRNIDEFVEWMDKYCAFDQSPYMDWFDKNYCKKCEPVVVEDPEGYIDLEAAWCELHDKCKYFQNMDDIPTIKETIKMWLESECENK